MARPREIPKLVFTEYRGIGWHVRFYDPKTQQRRRHRFILTKRSDRPRAEELYLRWLRDEYGHASPEPEGETRLVTAGSIYHVGSEFIARLEKQGEKGELHPKTVDLRRRVIKQFMDWLPDAGAMRLEHLTMQMVEDYNESVSHESDSHVATRMQMVKKLIDRAGRPEYGQQMLPWNWDSRDTFKGKRAEERRFLTIEELCLIHHHSSPMYRAVMWCGLGLGFGATDVAALRWSHLDLGESRYDMRRGKTGLDRFGHLPPILRAMLNNLVRQTASPVFQTAKKRPLVHARGNAIDLWWDRLRDERPLASIPGFYTLRHMGATERGSRPEASTADVKGWLGHSIGSRTVDRYMRPVKPEHVEVINFIRESLDDPDYYLATVAHVVDGLESN